MTFMEKEIFEQPSCLRKTLAYNLDTLTKIEEECKQKKIRTVIFAARGSSDNSGVLFKYLCEVLVGIPVSFAAPSVFTVYNAFVNYEDTIVIGVSQSGQAKDVLAVMDAANKQNAMTIAITNYIDSPLAKAGKHHLYLNVGEEKSVAATKTFSAQMYLLSMLVSKLSGNTLLEQDLLLVPNALEETLQYHRAIEEQAFRFKDVQNCFVLGRGYQYAISQEIALKLQETTYIQALSYAMSDFYHGPFALTEKKSNFIILAPLDETYENAQEMIQAIQKVDANIIVFTSPSGDHFENSVRLPNHPKYIMPFVMIMAGQLFALYTAIAKGLNPDIPRGLKKVTITE